MNRLTPWCRLLPEERYFTSYLISTFSQMCKCYSSVNAMTSTQSCKTAHVHAHMCTPSPSQVRLLDIWLVMRFWFNLVCSDTDQCTFITFLPPGQPKRKWRDVWSKVFALHRSMKKTHKNTLTLLQGNPYLWLLYQYHSSETVSLLFECCLQPVLPNFLSLSFPLYHMTFCIICFFGITSSQCDTSTVNPQYCQEIIKRWGREGEAGA